MYTRKCSPRKAVSYTSLNVGATYTQKDIDDVVLSLLIAGRLEDAKFRILTQPCSSELKVWCEEMIEENTRRP